MANHDALLARMSESRFFETEGYRLLSQSDRGHELLDKLRHRGFFDRSRVPLPEVSEQGHVRFDYWAGPDYLLSVASFAKKLGNRNLAVTVLDIIRRLCGDDHREIQDPYSLLKFAEILSIVPVELIQQEDIENIGRWISAKYNPSIILNSISSGLIANLLDSDDPRNHRRALQIVIACTSLSEFDQERPTTKLDEYLVGQTLRRHAALLGLKLGGEAVRFFESKVIEIFSGARARLTSLWRPAIENNTEQNLEWRFTENVFVDSLRDSLLEWSATPNDDVLQYLKLLLKKKPSILPRVAIHVLEQRLDLYPKILISLLTPVFFGSDFHHEMWRFLNRRFPSFGETERQKVLRQIRNLSPKFHTEQSLAYAQLRWLLAIRESQYWPAELLVQELSQKVTELPDVPDFLSYHSVSWGPGKSPFNTSELIEAAKERRLIELVASFNEPRRISGPTRDGLLDALQDAAFDQPFVFMELPLSNLPHDILRSISGGIRRYVRERIEESVWREVFSWFRILVTLISASGPGQDSYHDWILSDISDALIDGSADGARSIPNELEEECLGLIVAVLETAKGFEFDDESESDLLTKALNTSRGKAVLALLNYALCICRRLRQSGKAHDHAWEKLAPLFDAELSKTDKNFEFIALSCNHLLNFEFLSFSWIEANVDRLFPKSDARGFKCALAGLSYSGTSARTYQLLRKTGVLSKCINEASEDQIRHFVEIVFVAYLSEVETLNSETMELVFRRGPEAIQDAAHWLWIAHKEDLDETKKSRIIEFWSASLNWAESRNPKEQKVISALSRLSVYVTRMDGRTYDLLMRTGPFFIDYDETFFGALIHLAVHEPQKVAEILSCVFREREARYDSDHQLRDLLHILLLRANSPTLMSVFDKCLKLPEIRALYDDWQKGELSPHPPKP